MRGDNEGTAEATRRMKGRRTRRTEPRDGVKNKEEVKERQQSGGRDRWGAKMN